MKPETSIIKGMPEAEYRAHPALAKSDVDKWISGERPSGRQLTFGSAFHLGILEPERAKREIVFCKEPTPLNTKAGKEAWAAFESANPGKLCLMLREFEVMRGMFTAVKDHPKITAIRNADGDRELSVFWQDEPTGLWLKARIDQVPQGKFLIDWKTSGYLTAEEFDQSIIGYSYHLQAAWYQYGYQVVTGKTLPFAFAVCSKRAPNPCFTRRVSDNEIALGTAEMRRLLTLYARYEKQSLGEQP